MKYKKLLAFLAIPLFSTFTVSPVMSSVIYSGRLNLTGPDFSVDINKDGITDFTTSWRTWGWGNGSSSNGYDVDLNFAIRFLNTKLPPMYGDGFPAEKAPLNYKELIGPNPPNGLLWSYNSNDPMVWTIYDMWSNPVYTYSGLWNNLQNKYMGFELSSGLDTFYGWIHLDINASNDVVLVDYAYENVPGRSITAGTPTPEPATMLLLGAGLVGIATARRKKKA